MERCFWCHRFQFLTRPPCHGLAVYELREQRRQVLVTFPCNLLLEPNKRRGRPRDNVRCQLERRGCVDAAVAISYSTFQENTATFWSDAVALGVSGACIGPWRGTGSIRPGD